MPAETMRPEAELQVVRKPLPHDSAPRHVTGTAAYIDDIREPSGTLHLAPGYAPIASGRIISVDLSAVRAAPGVVTVLTGEDIPGANDISPKQIGDDPAEAHRVASRAARVGTQRPRTSRSKRSP